MSIEWANPGWLLLLLALPPYALWVRRRRAAAVPLPRSGRMAAKGSRGTRLLAAAPAALRLLALAALLLALARPRSPGRVVEERSEGVPLVVALDLSSSMLAEDFRPRNRLEVAKRTVAAFIRGRPDDPIGIVAFAAEAITVVPITTYQPVLVNALRSLRVGLLEDGTAIGDGLAVAVDRLRRVKGSDRVVILMSDGESNRGAIDPMDAARAAAAFGIEVITIGVGSEGVARVPVERASGGLRYAELPVDVDEELLQRIAEVTGGRYFRATNPEALRAIYARIEEMVATPTETRRRVLYTEWYLPLLALAALALVVEWLLRGSRWGVVPG